MPAHEVPGLSAPDHIFQPPLLRAVALGLSFSQWNVSRRKAPLQGGFLKGKAYILHPFPHFTLTRMCL